MKPATIILYLTVSTVSALAAAVPVTGTQPIPLPHFSVPNLPYENAYTNSKQGKMLYLPNSKGAVMITKP